MSGLFRDLSPEEEKEFRQWAHENYTPGDNIKGIWHPVVQDECRKINEEVLGSDQYLDGLAKNVGVDPSVLNG